MGQQILLIAHILLALAIIGLILLQHGKGAEVGAAFGSGASQTLFGSRGSASFLTKLTTLLAIGFAITSLSMSYVSARKLQGSDTKSILDTIEEIQKAEEIPVLPEAEVIKEETSDNGTNKEAVKESTEGKLIKHNKIQKQAIKRKVQQKTQQ